MSVNSAEILLPSRAYIYLAPVGTTAPTTAVSVLAVGWKNVGLTTPDSLSIAEEPEFAEVTSHQSDFPVKRMQTSDSCTISVDLQQWNTSNLLGVFGGGTVVETTTGSGTWKFTPPKLGARLEKSCIVEIIDGTEHYRWVFPRCMQIEGVTSDLQKGQEARLPLRLAVLGDDSADAFYMLTDNAAFTAST